MELALRVTSWPRMDGKDLSMLCRSSSRSRTQLSHTAGEHSSQHRPLLGFPPLFPQDSGTQTFTLHAVGAVCHQDLVLAQADVTLLPCEPAGARALPGARVTGAPSALTLCRVE